MFSYRKILKYFCIHILCNVVITQTIEPGQGKVNTESLKAKAKAHKALQDSYLQLFDKPGYHSNDNAPVVEEDLPDISHVSSACSKNEFFFNTNPKHMQAVLEFRRIIMSQQNSSDFIRLAARYRTHGGIHKKVWLEAVLGATELRPDTRHFQKPALVEVVPDRFVPIGAIDELTKRYAEGRADNNTCIRLDERFGRDNGRENLLWYWREDLMINSHHWYWHMEYPAFSTAPRADRRGELFYYMHQHALARYDAERLSQGLSRVAPLVVQNNNNNIINEGYYAHLNDTVSGQTFADRPPQTPLGDVYLGSDPEDPSGNSELSLNIEKVVRYSRRIEGAIDAGTFNDSNGNRVNLQNYQGIDILVDITEACLYSRNSLYFGRTGVHNMMHNIIAFILDAKPHEARPPFIPGVMADTATSMRDVVFYRWHKYIDEIFVRHKQLLPPYTQTDGEFPLSYGVKITSFKITSFNGRTNILNTFWSQKVFDLSRGLDLGRPNNGPLNLCVKHLDHEDFQYTITIERDRVPNITEFATIRIFMAPRNSENGSRYTIDEQRRLFFALDIFTVNMNSVRNTIVRNSQDSTVTIPFAKSYEELQTAQFRPYCGCGMPHHLLLPRGSETGIVYDVFAMITDEDPPGSSASASTVSPDGVRDDDDTKAGNIEGCHQAPVLCGYINEKYPYKHPMGYPFDRVPHNITILYKPNPIFWWDWVTIRRRAVNLEEFISGNPNMAAIEVSIFHNNRNPTS